MATMIDTMIADSEGVGRKTPKVIVGALSIIADPDKPSFASDRHIANSQFEHLRRALTGPDAPEPSRNPVWTELGSLATRIRTQQSVDVAPPAAGGIPEDALVRTAMLTDVGMKRLALANRIAEVAPDAEGRNSALRAVGNQEIAHVGHMPLVEGRTAAIREAQQTANRIELRAPEGDAGDRLRDWAGRKMAEAKAPPPRLSVNDGLAASQAGAAAWNTDEGKTARLAVRALTGEVGPAAARAVVSAAAGEATQRRMPDATEQATPGFTEAWGSVAAMRVRNSFQALDRAIDGNRRETLVSAVMKAADEEGFSGKGPSARIGSLPGFTQAWESEPGKALRGSMALLGREAARAATTAEPGPDGLAADPRATYDRWITAAPRPVDKAVGRWTDNYAVVMDNESSSRVVREFIGVALRAYDANRTPDKAELTKEVEGIRQTLATPVKEPRSETTVTYRPVRAVDNEGRPQSDARGNPIYEVQTDGQGRPIQYHDGTAVPKLEAITQHRTREVTVRPALVGPDPYNRGLVGLEGQAYFDNTDVIKAAMQARRSDAQAKPAAFISFAEPGTTFRAALEQSAQELGIPIVRARLDATSREYTVADSRKLQHVDGEYLSDRETRVRLNERSFTIPYAKGPESSFVEEALGPKTPREGTPVPFDSLAGKDSARGRLVLVDISTPETAGQREARLAESPSRGGREKEPVMNFIARINNGALTAPDLVTFGGSERSEENIFKMQHRRALSGMPMATMINSDGETLGSREIAELTAKRGVQKGEKAEERARWVAAVPSWSTTDERAHLLVAAVIPSRQQQSALLNGFPTLGEAIKAGQQAPLGDRRNAASAGETIATAPRIDPEQREATFAAVAFAKATANTNAFPLTVDSVRRRLDTAASTARRLRADPRDPIVAKVGPIAGDSSAPETPKGATYAIIGDTKPATPAMIDQIDRVVGNLAKLHGRDEDGRGLLKINTTLTPGIGQAVMEAGLKYRVPVEAIGAKDDAAFKRDTPDLIAFAAARRLFHAGLGGTWTVAEQYPDGRMADASPEKAARAAIEGANAVVVSRIGRDDPLKMVVASAGVTKPVMTLPASRDAEGRPDNEGWRGTAELSTPGTRMRAEIPVGPRHDPAFVAAGAILGRGRAEDRDGTRRDVILASVDTGMGATELRTPADLRMLQRAAAGEIDLRMGRQDPAAPAAAAEEARKRSAPAPDVRWNVLDKLDLDQFGDKKYRESLQLTATETKLAEATYRRFQYQIAVEAPMPVVENAGPTSELGRLLGQRFAVKESPQTRVRARAGDGAGL
jgi:hypothetical protein